MPKKVVIRLINKKNFDQDEIPKPKEGYVYHWNRIFTALFLLVAVIGSLSFGISRLLSDKDGSQPASEPQSRAEPEQPAIPSRPEAATATQSPKPAQTAVPAAGFSILSKNIKRTQLASNVIDGEPVDTIGPVIPMNEKGLIKVYLFFEATGLKGRRLHHDWYWKGKRMAHVPVPIKENSQTASTSKFIDRIMTGSWEVRITDEKGDSLANATFEVR